MSLQNGTNSEFQRFADILDLELGDFDESSFAHIDALLLQDLKNENLSPADEKEPGTQNRQSAKSEPNLAPQLSEVNQGDSLAEFSPLIDLPCHGSPWREEKYRPTLQAPWELIPGGDTGGIYSVQQSHSKHENQDGDPVLKLSKEENSLPSHQGSTPDDHYEVVLRRCCKEAHNNQRAQVEEPFSRVEQFIHKCYECKMEFLTLASLVNHYLSYHSSLETICFTIIPPPVFGFVTDHDAAETSF